MPILAPKDATRDALLAAATAEMAAAGIDGASLDAICARAGFTRGAFYVHFRDRDDLLAAVVDRILSHTQDQLFASDAGGEPDLRQTMLRFIARIVAGDPAAVGTASWKFRHTLAACARVPAVRERYLALQRRGVQRIGRSIVAGQRAGTVRGDVDPAPIAEIFVIVSLGISAALDLGMPINLLAGGAALERLLASSAPPSRRSVRASTRRRRRASRSSRRTASRR